jgi:L-alanine-DL-glutamate epimerase-like enolase superfamily enzyme
VDGAHQVGVEGFVALALNTALEAAIPRLVHMGFRQMKMQCGSEPTVEASVERVRVVRHAIGPDVDLMCDINQLWSVHHAIEVGRRVEAYQLFWLEDPTAHDDFAGLARVADSLSTPIAAGEYHYGIVPFRHLLEARSIDIVMIDLLRVRRYHAVHEGGWHGRGIQSARRQSPDP